MTGSAWVDAVLLVLALAFGVSAVVFAALWANARDRQAQPAAADTTDPRAATVAALLRPDDPALPDEEASLIAATVARAADAYASVLAAKRTGLGPVVVQQLTNAMYADLVRSLTPEQLARAVCFGLHPHADERARYLLDTDRLSTEYLES